jgi:hypothetical protein
MTKFIDAISPNKNLNVFDNETMDMQHVQKALHSTERNQ